MLSCVAAYLYFNPRTSCEVRPADAVRSAGEQIISIHAPRVRCDFILYFVELQRLIFQSTHLVWGATVCNRSCRYLYVYFNPRTSCEVRPVKDVEGLLQPNISIHAPRVRCDVCRIDGFSDCCYFNPRTSCEVRLQLSKIKAMLWIFQSTHLVWGATRVKHTLSMAFKYFNPRTSCEVRPDTFRDI